jgi:hypothetical protein
MVWQEFQKVSAECVLSMEGLSCSTLTYKKFSSKMGKSVEFNLEIKKPNAKI